MTNFWFIRHGESESNAGLPSVSDATTPLTKKGVEQAGLVANHLTTPPDKFVVSPYLRTQQTAAPTLLKFTNVPVETWQVQEYSYLSHAQYKNTTPKHRRKLSQSYFLAADPELVLGDGGESFNQFIQRVKTSIQMLLDSPDNFTIIFGHGWFMRALLWVLYQEKETLEEKRTFLQYLSTIMHTSTPLLKLFGWMDRRKRIKKMFTFLIFSAGMQTPNCSIIKFQASNEKFELVGYDASHLPDKMQETTLINR